jgi:hypothetical protein
MHAASNGIRWVGDASPDRESFVGARNSVVQSVIETQDVDGIFWCDSDIILPAHAITSMVITGREFITGIYCQRNPPHYPVVGTFDKRLKKFRWLVEWPDNSVVPIDGCGFGCVYTSMEIFRSVPSPWFEWKDFGEDLTMCLKAMEAQFQLYVHTGVQCGHIGEPVAVTYADYQRVRNDTISKGGLP